MEIIQVKIRRKCKNAEILSGLVAVRHKRESKQLTHEPFVKIYDFGKIRSFINEIKSYRNEVNSSHNSPKKSDMEEDKQKDLQNNKSRTKSINSLKEVNKARFHIIKDNRPWRVFLTRHYNRDKKGRLHPIE